jgi:hypothetical protein
MCNNFSYDELKIVPYRKRHNVSRFESRTADLNAFLKEDASKNQEELISKTYLCCHSNQLVGYITLTTDIIRKEKVREEGRISVPYKEYPAIKIARLAVDKKYEVGCRFITVDSKQDSIGFYKKGGGFELAKRYQDKTYPTMYLDILPIHEKMKAVNTELGDFQTSGI